MQSRRTWTVGSPASSNAETTLASRGDVAVFGDIRVVKGRVARSSSTREELRLGLNLDLVRDGRPEKGGRGSNEEGKQDAGNNFFHRVGEETVVKGKKLLVVD
jgi:hypothetical protein